MMQPSKSHQKDTTDDEEELDELTDQQVTGYGVWSADADVGIGARLCHFVPDQYDYTLISFIGGCRVAAERTQRSRLVCIS